VHSSPVGLAGGMRPSPDYLPRQPAGMAPSASYQLYVGYRQGSPVLGVCCLPIDLIDVGANGHWLLMPTELCSRTAWKMALPRGWNSRVPGLGYGQIFR
jgi:hypothetical protein